MEAEGQEEEGQSARRQRVSGELGDGPHPNAVTIKQN